VCELTVQLPDDEGRVVFRLVCSEGLVADGRMLLVTEDSDDV
jgi:hypothetical protein